jgi:hypothetical protein
MVWCCAWLAACNGDQGRPVTVSGKTVFRDMGVEEVLVQVWREESTGRLPVAETRSGYHGSFVFRLVAGAYALDATTEIPAADGNTLRLTGELRGVEVLPDKRRLDRLLIRLEAVEDSRSRAGERPTTRLGGSLGGG